VSTSRNDKKSRHFIHFFVLPPTSSNINMQKLARVNINMHKPASKYTEAGTCKEQDA
jgi:hypothetical protein